MVGYLFSSVSNSVVCKKINSIIEKWTVGAQSGGTVCQGKEGLLLITDICLRSLI